ncbi:tetratricopeptide (TPR) repeat protein [Saccharothrix tamanrassetensis]|uniref:Tetratricopeptide (TPR) repeat protein n=1 Tax=Saccharothrix tamanrassetensis TaxID=1051531 RepID=A0A841CU59_9PSEU|nr:tetratricopeptide repeat protein [Saccharothrix tamanrassetensis]MBB5959567.1 tetratricopeptide (TPR) repeat protein [Saccharothrix tamanrassetensis]
MVGSAQAVHRTIVVVDVEGFGDPSRTLPHQLGTRAGLYRVVAEALGAAGVPWEDCYHEDRGDGVLVLVPPGHAKAPLVEVLPGALVEAVRAHNDTSPAAQRTRLRVAVHAGEVVFDRHGVTSTAVTTAFRLLDAPPVRQALARSPGLVALVVSRWLFDEVVRQSAVLDPATFRPVPVEVKEFRDTAWIALPDHPHPADQGVPDRPANPAAADGSGVTPRQLPGAPAPFVGREEYLAALDRALTAADADPATGTAVVISALGGAGGIGKTWLALHWAHRHADRFPDGQLFVDLRGFSPDSSPLQPAAAVRGFLDALGIAPGGLPVDPDAQAALYRSLVADRRMLIVLDNAATTDQVVPLLPGTPTCTVLVTGRTKLASLIDRHGARHVQLDVLSPGEARAVLSERLGDGRVAAEPEATGELIELCGRYPLALAITARHAATRPQVPLAEFAAELRDLGLDMLDDDDPAASLPTVLSWSLRRLTDEQRTVLALLGIAPGPDIDLSAAASLTGLPPAEARKALRALEGASLLDRRPRGRYAMHDLVRAYAAVTAHDDLSEPVRRAALERVVDFYLHAAHTADRLLDPHRTPIRLAPPAPGTHPHPLSDRPAALAWLDTHHAHLLAAQHTATGHDRHQAVWDLAWTLGTFQLRQGHRHDALAVWQAATDAATHLADPATRAHAHRLLGRAHTELGQHEQAVVHLHQALATEHHDRIEQAHTHRALARVWELQGDNRQALKQAGHALDLFRGLDQPMWETVVLNDVGWYAALSGEYDTARDHCQAALALHRRHRHPEGEADTLDSLGYIEHRTGHHHRATHHYQQALNLYRTLGIATKAADTLDRLGHPHAALGRHEQARAVWREALDLYRTQEREVDAQRVRQQLDDLDNAADLALGQ